MRSAIKLLSLLCVFFAVASLEARAASCNISNTGVAFGTYYPLERERRDTIGTIVITCLGQIGDAVSYSLQLDTIGRRGVYRVMTIGAHELNYLIFTDNSYARVWGDGSAGSFVVSDSYTMATSSTVRSYPIFGRIPAGQNQAIAGVYISSLTVTLEY